MLSDQSDDSDAAVHSSIRQKEYIYTVVSSNPKTFLYPLIGPEILDTDRNYQRRSMVVARHFPFAASSHARKEDQS
jgi:hypothetical protein